MNLNTPMTITIDIPAVQALANAINNLAESQRRTSGPVSLIPPLTPDEFNKALADQGLAAMDPTEDNPSPEPAPKRTRRTKAEMEAERKAIEEQKGRRVDPPTEQNIVTDQPEPSPGDPEPTPFQWTLEQLKDTFIAPITDNDLRNELIAIRQEVDPQAPTLAKVDPQHYPELAKRFTAWFNDKGLKLQLPEGAE